MMNYYRTPFIEKKNSVRNVFTPEEDEMLKQLVQVYGTNQWYLISLRMKGRDIRQCRERYIHYLDPKLNQTPWTKEEEELLVQKVNELGHKWKAMEKFFNNRTHVNIKNKWNKLERIRNRILNSNLQNKCETTEIPQNVEKSDVININDEKSNILSSNDETKQTYNEKSSNNDEFMHFFENSFMDQFYLEPVESYDMVWF